MSKLKYTRKYTILIIVIELFFYCWLSVQQIVREKISTSTVLLIAKTAGNLRKFYVRRNAVIIRCDWPKNPDWMDDFFEWLRMACKSYDSTEREVSQMFGYRWVMLSDQMFKQVDINVREGI